jgi:hypothetical protein
MFLDGLLSPFAALQNVLDSFAILPAQLFPFLRLKQRGEFRLPPAFTHSRIVHSHRIFLKLLHFVQVFIVILIVVFVLRLVIFRVAEKALSRSRFFIIIFIFCSCSGSFFSTFRLFLLVYRRRR